MTLEEWRHLPAPRGRWRRRAREAIREVVDANAAGYPEQPLHDRVLKLIDEAYPFGEREYAPYKAWLAERKLFRAALAAKPAPSMPTEDEAAACEVARDMVLEGRLDEARAALEQAPNRLARKCPACGAWPGTECHTMPSPDGAQRCTCPSFASCDDIAAAPLVARDCPGCGATTDHLLVPHLARLVGHRDAGPLFGGEP